MNALKVCLPLTMLGLIAGCSNPADNVSAAKVGSPGEPAPAPATAPSSVPVKRFVFGPENSKVEFVGSKVTGSHNGGFKKFEGELLVGADGQLLGAGNKVTIETASLWADNDRLTGHLKSPDFFNVEGHPTSIFVSTDIARQGTNSTVSGNLTLHGVTKQISFPASIQVTDQAVNVQADFSINRYDFEMKYPGKADDLIRKEVVLKLHVKAVPPGKDVATK